MALAWQCAAQQPEPQWEVYYQVTYADGSVRDLNKVPATNAGIRRVVRISHLPGSGVGFAMFATGSVMGTVTDRGQTVRNDLVWNGKAWVAQPELCARRIGRTGSSKQVRNVLQNEKRRISQLLKELRGRLATLDHEVAEAQRKLDAAKGTASADDLAAALTEVTERREAVLKTIELYNLQLKALTVTDLSSTAAAATGKVSAGGLPTPDKNTLGLRHQQRADMRPVTLPHRMQVWKMPPSQGKRTVQVAMAHPEAGPFGAFQYVAYADTDGDGRPDKLIARSPLVSSTVPGGWTNWTFTTSEPVVFVGNTWADPDTTVYFTRPSGQSLQQCWGGLSNEVYVSGVFGGIPHWRWPYGPYLTNIQVHVTNPFAPEQAGSTRIIAP